MTAHEEEDPVSAIIGAHEEALRERLQAGNALVALEVDGTVAEFQRLMTALRLACAMDPPPDDLTDGDPDRFVLDYVDYQAAKDADKIATSAETRAQHSLRAAKDVWKGYLEGQRRKGAWERVQKGRAGR